MGSARGNLLDREVSLDVEDQQEVESEGATRTGSMTASSLGVSFLVPLDVTTVVVEAAWGRYERRPSESQVTEQGRPRVVWVRRPAGGQVEVPVEGEASDVLVPDPEQEDVQVRYIVALRDVGRPLARVVHIALVNEQALPSGTPDTHRLYQAGLTVTALDGASAIFVGHNDPELSAPPASSDPERLYLALLHRGALKYATGRQCAVDADVRDGQQRA